MAALLLALHQEYILMELTMQTLRKYFGSPYLLWLLLALPAIPVLASALGGTNVERLLNPTGEFSARFMIMAMVATPLRMLFPSACFTNWLIKSRRYFGVAAFSYALLHTIFYIIDEGSLRHIIREFSEFEIWTGWAAFAIFLPLALTSNNYSVRKLLKWWKPLQRFVYAAAVFTLLHWIFVDESLGSAMLHFIPLAGLEAYRIRKNFQTSKRKQSR